MLDLIRLPLSIELVRVPGKGPWRGPMQFVMFPLARVRTTNVVSIGAKKGLLDYSGSRGDHSWSLPFFGEMPPEPCRILGVFSGLALLFNASRLRSVLADGVGGRSVVQSCVRGAPGS